MKKNFKKFVATSLALGTFASAIPTFAMKPAFPNPKSAITETILDLASCVREFESLAPGVFYVETDFVKSDPMIAHKILNQITKIFKIYPKITKKFIERTKQTTEKKFTVKPFTAKASKIASGGISSHKGMGAGGMFYESHKRMDMFINPHELSNQRTFIMSLKPFFPELPMLVALEVPDFETGLVSHEMGHLIFSIVYFSKHGKLYDDYIAGAEKIKKQFCKLYDSNASDSEVLNFTMHAGEICMPTDCQKVIATMIEIQAQIINLARTKYGYTGYGMISNYANMSPNEWLAEVFAHAMCSESPNALGKATLEYLNDIEKSL